MLDSIALRKISEEAVVDVGDNYLRGVFRKGVEFEQKTDIHDLVTIHDRACEKRLISFIRDRVSDANIIGEEFGLDSGGGRTTWYLDPIDGTSNFVQGLAFFCSVVGVAVDDVMVAGAVYDPIAKNLFSADEDAAYLNGEVLQTGKSLKPGEATLITGYPTAKDLTKDGNDIGLEIFGNFVEEFSSVRRTGSGALSLCHVAAGWTDAAFGTQVHPWDVSSPMLIVRKAGGRYLPLKFSPNDGDEHNAPGYIAVREGGDFPSLNLAARKIKEIRSKL